MKRFIPAIAFPISFFLMCVIVFGALVFLDSIFDRRETKTNRFYHFYSIVPESLLDVLDTNQVNIFSPISEEPSFLPSNQQVPVPWKQDDYFRIANALFAFVWGDSLDGWQLNSMSLNLDCPDSSFGLQESNFTFFKNQHINNAESRFERIIKIDAKNKYIYVSESVYYPKLANWSSIDLENNQFSASEILQIADNNGAKSKRESVENACDIYLLLAPGSPRYEGWQVYFRGVDKDRARLFYVEIDPFTGEANVP